jgi:hypothetical protein
MKLKDIIHVELKDGRKPDALDYAAAAILGGTMVLMFAPLVAVAYPLSFLKKKQPLK